MNAVAGKTRFPEGKRAMNEFPQSGFMLGLLSTRSKIGGDEAADWGLFGVAQVLAPRGS